MVTFTLAAIETANKGTLRSMCRDCGIAATTLNVDGMRDALRTHASDYTAPSLDIVDEAGTVDAAQVESGDGMGLNPALFSSDEIAANDAAAHNSDAALLDGALAEMQATEAVPSSDAVETALAEGFTPIVEPMVAPPLPVAPATPALDAAAVLAALPEHMRTAAAALFAATKPGKVEKVRAVRVPRDESNGVKRPAADTLCGRIWSYCDTQVSQGVRPEAKALRSHFDGKTEGVAAIDPTTCTVQYYRWRKFNFITGR